MIANISRKLNISNTPIYMESHTVRRQPSGISRPSWMSEGPSQKRFRRLQRPPVGLHWTQHPWPGRGKVETSSLLVFCLTGGTADCQKLQKNKNQQLLLLSFCRRWKMARIASHAIQYTLDYFSASLTNTNAKIPFFVFLHSILPIWGSVCFRIVCC